MENFTLEQIINEVEYMLDNCQSNSGSDIEAILESYQDVLNEIQKDIETLEEEEELDEEQKKELSELKEKYEELKKIYDDAYYKFEEILNYDEIISEYNLNEYIQNMIEDGYSEQLDNLPDFIKDNIDWDDVIKDCTRYDYSLFSLNNIDYYYR